MSIHLSRSIVRAPAYAYHRHVVAAADSVTSTNVKQGINCAGYEKVNIQVVPSTLCNPNVEAMVWSEKAAKFISLTPAVTKTGIGAGLSYEFQIAGEHRIVWIKVTGGTITTGDTVDIYANGVPGTAAFA